MINEIVITLSSGFTVFHSLEQRLCNVSICFCCAEIMELPGRHESLMQRLSRDVLYHKPF